MIKGYVNNVEKNISRVAMPVNNVDKGWEVRAQDGTIIWGADKTLTGVSTIGFKGYGLPLKSCTIKGNGSQTGTPTPDNLVMPEFCGKLVGANWTIPITCAGQTVPVYLGQTQTVRRVKKVVFDGTEGWTENTSGENTFRARLALSQANIDNTAGYCSHLPFVASGISQDIPLAGCYNSAAFLRFDRNMVNNITEFKSYLAQQYAAGTPITVWYVLATPTTGIVDEPLAKIGDYADELNSTDAGVSIPTANGQNVLTVDTTLPPSSLSITGHIKPIT